ncbi:MAG: calcium/sodium antiporter, partial [Flavobacteriales bacterium]|nr:calcium/sodium antiporter [Flavobacteriales bacterium]
ATHFKIAPMVIGLTIVSIGTSAPELLVSIQAALSGSPDIAIGNVIGSNIANLALVLGVTALILPIPVARNTIRIDWPVMMVATLVFWWMMMDGVLSFFDGMVLFLSLVAYIIYLLVQSKRNPFISDSDVVDDVGKRGGLWIELLKVVLGCIGLVFGADLLVSGASDLARGFGVSEHVIGVTVVAFGTSVPELATSMVAAIKKELDISVGNLIGSNIFNILSILGITSMVKPIPINDVVLASDIFWVLGVTLLILPLAVHRFRIHRWKGALLLGIYLTYILVVIS